MCPGSWYNNLKKTNIDFVSVTQKYILYRTCFKWPPLRWWHTWICRANLSINLTHSFFCYGTNLLNDAHFEFSNGLRIVLIHVVLQELPVIKISEVQIGWMQTLLWFVASADQPIRESMVEPLHLDIGCMWSCSILLEPLHVSIHTTTCSKCPPELVQHINVTLL